MRLLLCVRYRGWVACVKWVSRQVGRSYATGMFQEPTTTERFLPGHRVRHANQSIGKQKVSVPQLIGLRKNLEVLAVDEIVILQQEIACVLHFASDLFFLDSVTE